ncbi:MAG: FecR family protein [Nanoarchaeota archaeon]|nr:FecR family protein [Nanoarchaeota archaeon]
MNQLRGVILILMFLIALPLCFGIVSRDLADIPDINGECKGVPGPDGTLLPCPDGKTPLPTTGTQTSPTAKKTTPAQPEVTTTQDDDYYDQQYENRLYKEFKYMMPEEELTPEEYEIIKIADERLGQIESVFLACGDSVGVRFESCFSGCLYPENVNTARCNACIPNMEQESAECHNEYIKQTDQVSNEVEQALTALENNKEKPEQREEPEDELSKFQREYGTANLLRDGDNWHLEGCSGCLLQGDQLLTSDSEHIWFNGVGLSTGGKASIRLIQDDAEKQIISYESGTVHFRYSKSEKKYEVQARGVKIGITGTEFLLEEQGDATLLLLKEGSLELETSEGKKTMSAGQQAIISEGNAVISYADPAVLEKAMDQFKIGDSGKTILLWISLFFFLVPIIAGIIIIKMFKPKPKTTYYGIIGFVLSLLSIPFIILAPFGWCLAYLALILSSLQKKANPTGLARAGFAIGMISAILCAIILIPWFIYLFQ